MQPAKSEAQVASLQHKFAMLAKRHQHYRPQSTHPPFTAEKQHTKVAGLAAESTNAMSVVTNSLLPTRYRPEKLEEVFLLCTVCLFLYRLFASLSAFLPMCKSVASSHYLHEHFASCLQYHGNLNVSRQIATHKILISLCHTCCIDPI